MAQKIGYLYEVGNHHQRNFLQNGNKDHQFFFYSNAWDVLEDIENVRSLDVLIVGVNISATRRPKSDEDLEELKKLPFPPEGAECPLVFALVDELKSKEVETPITVFSIRVDTYGERLTELGCFCIEDGNKVDIKKVPSMALARSLT